MDKKLFEIRCTTCEARFGVIDSSLVGEIVACPKCGGMILVQPPQKLEDESFSKKDALPDTETDIASVPPIHPETFSTEVASVPVGARVVNMPPILSALSEPEIPLTQTDTDTENKKPPVLPTALEAPPVLDDVPAADQSVWNSRLLLVLIGTACVLFLSVTILLVIRSRQVRPPVAKEPPTATAVPNQKSAESPAHVDNDKNVNTDSTVKDDSSQKPKAATQPTEGTNTVAASGTAVPDKSQAKSPDTPASSASPFETPAPPASAGVSESPNMTPESVPAASGNPADATPASPATATTTPSASHPFMTTPNATGTSSTVAHGTKQDGTKGSGDSTQPGTAAKAPDATNPTSKGPSNQKGEKDDEEEFVLGESGNTQASLLKSLQPLKKTTPIIDVKSRLAQPLVSIEFSGQSLAETVRILSGLSGVPIVFDLDCMEQIRPLCSARVQFRLEGKTVRDSLNETARLSKLLVKEENGRILLTMPDQDAFVAASFDLSGLASGSVSTTSQASKTGGTPPADKSGRPRALSTAITQDELTRLVKEMISPGSWDSAGGKGSLHWEKQTLHVNQTADHNLAMKRLFEQLRTIRILSRQTDMANELLVPEITCWDKLSQTMSLSYFENVPLMDPIGLIANEAKLEFLFDDAELARKGINRESSAAIRVDHIPIDQVLTTLLTPLKLDYVVLGANLILLTSQEAAREYKTFEVHLFAPPDSAKPSESQVRSLVEQIKTSVSPGSWKDNQDFIWYDMTSCCLLIRQSQPVQRQIRSWLERHIQQQSQPAKAVTAPDKKGATETPSPKTPTGEVKSTGEAKPTGGATPVSGVKPTGDVKPTGGVKPDHSAGATAPTTTPTSTSTGGK